eukprot:TRINITY_DN3507_c0_g1_i3.p1 TRINITY_DN3507_c0_g1~~TRINITY_DN3507_c0_g1_i3.p1  ORF type:complete len:1215 (+),score=382.18 TRINITY_DN3507_c0_g1_i3:128-3772(+)
MNNYASIWLFCAAIIIATLLDGLYRLAVCGVLIFVGIAHGIHVLRKRKETRLVWLLFLQRFCSARVWNQYIIECCRAEADDGRDGAMCDVLQFSIPGMSPFFYIIEPDLIKKVLILEVEHFPKSDSGASKGGSYLFGGRENILLREAPSDAIWRMHRAVTRPLNHDKIGSGSVVGELFESSWRNAQRCADKIVPLANGKKVDLFYEVFKFAVNVHNCSLFGEEFDEKNFPGLTETMLDNLNMVATDSVFPRFGLPGPSFFEKRRVGKVFEHISHMAKTSSTPLLKLLRRSAAEANMPEEQFNSTSAVLTYGLAPAYVVFWALYCLSLHPQVEQLLLDEIRATMSENGRLSYEKVTTMPYLAKVVAETLRLYPGVPMLFSRTTTQSVMLGRHFIPAGSTIAIAPCVHQRNGKFWRNPDMFDPDRPGLDATNSSMDLKHMPFGAGARICQGQFYAENLVKACVVAIISRFSLRVADGERPALPNPSIYNIPHRRIMYRLELRHEAEPSAGREPLLASSASVDQLSQSTELPGMPTRPMPAPLTLHGSPKDPRPGTRAAPRGLEGAVSFMSPRMAQQEKQLKALIEHEHLGGALQAKPMLVLYASQSGKSRAFARRFARLGRHTQISVQCCSAADYSFDMLQRAKLVVVVCSTYGNGDPPDEGRALNDWLGVSRRPADLLKSVEFAVLALGSSVFPNCFAFGKYVDRRLAELGGTRLIPIGILDEIKYRDQPDFSAWSLRLFRKIGTGDARVAATVRAKGIMGLYDPNTQPQPMIAIKFEGTDLLDTRVAIPDGSVDLFVTKNECATRDPDNVINHIELKANPGSHFVFQTGDEVLVYPRNSPARVEALIERLALPGDALFSVVTPSEDVTQLYCQAGYHMCTLRIALLSFFELGIVSTDLLRFLSSSTTKWSEQVLLDRYSGEDNAKFVMEHLDLLDVLNTFPGITLSGSQAEQNMGKLLSLLQPLKPRRYSISSSADNVRGLVRLTYKVIKFRNSQDKEHFGVCSSYLSTRKTGDKVSVRVQTSNFRLPPKHDVPIIMCAAGSGVSPFLAFIEERCLQAPQHSPNLRPQSRLSLTRPLHREPVNQQRQQPFLAVSPSEGDTISLLLDDNRREDAAKIVQRAWRKHAQLHKIRARLAGVPRPASPKSTLPKVRIAKFCPRFPFSVRRPLAPGVARTRIRVRWSRPGGRVGMTREYRAQGTVIRELYTSRLSYDCAC